VPEDDIIGRERGFLVPSYLEKIACHQNQSDRESACFRMPAIYTKGNSAKSGSVTEAQSQLCALLSKLAVYIIHVSV